MESKESTTGDPSADPLHDKSAAMDQGVLEYEPDSTSVKQEAAGDGENHSGPGSDVSLPRDLKFEASLVHSTRDVPCELWMPGLDSDDPLSEEKVSSFVEPLGVEGYDPLDYPEVAAKPEPIDSGNDESSSASALKIHPPEIKQDQPVLDKCVPLDSRESTTASTTDPDDPVNKAVVEKSGAVGDSPSATKEHSTANVLDKCVPLGSRESTAASTTDPDDPVNKALVARSGAVGGFRSAAKEHSTANVHPREDLAMLETSSSDKRHLEVRSLSMSSTRNLMDTLVESAWNDCETGPSSSTAASQTLVTAIHTSEGNQTSSTSTDLQNSQYEGLGEKMTPLLKVRSDLHDPANESLAYQTPTTSTDLQNSQYDLSEKTVTPLLKVRSDLLDLTREHTESTHPNINASVTDSLPCHNFKKCTQSKACQVNSFNPEIEFLKNVFAPSKAQVLPSVCYESNLDSYSKSIIYSVVEYFRKKKKKFGLKYLVKDVVADVTRLRSSTVDSVMRTAHKSLKDNPTLEYPRFQEYLTPSCIHCGEVLVDFAIRQIICNGYIREGKALAVKEVYKRLVVEEELPVCRDFLRRRIQDLGFDLMRSVATPRYIPLERPELAARRYRYFQEIQKCRIMQRQIVYIFEADVFKVSDTKGVWRPMEGHPTSSDTNMVTVIYAAKESGFIDGSLLCHSGTYREHRRKVRSLTQYWLSVHLPKLPLGSVVVLGHNRHHFMKPAKPKPDPSWPKQDILKWLYDHKEFSFSNMLPSAVLLEKVQAIDVGSKFTIDDMIISHGHIPLHLPPNHRELNPIELVWSKIAAKFPSAAISSEAFMRLFLMKEFDEIAPSELQEAFELAKIHENTHRQMDMRIDGPVAEVIRQVGGVLDRDYALEVDECSDEEVSGVLFETSLEQPISKSVHLRDQTSRENVSSLYQPSKKRKTSGTQAANPKNAQNRQTRPESRNQSQVTSTQETPGCSRDRNREDHPEWVISSSCTLIGPNDSDINRRPPTSGSAPLKNIRDMPLNSQFSQCPMPLPQNLATPAQLTASVTAVIPPFPEHGRQRKETITTVEVINLADSDEDTLSDPGPIDLTEDEENLAATASDTSAPYCPKETSENPSLSASSATPSDTTRFLRDLIKSKFQVLKKKM